MQRAIPKPGVKVGVSRSKNDDFVVQKEVGKGAFARVFRVVRKQDGQVYALKRIRITTMKRKEISDTLGEIRFLASIRHANLIRYYDSFYDEDTSEICIVMEYADGTSSDLSGLIQDAIKANKPFTESLVWSFSVQILQALAYLHKKKILHRDLKSANCFLTADGRLKLGDFNVSKHMKQGMARTQIGTPYFMSPEIYLYRPYDEKSDMWSVGCIIYEMCALRPPFRGRDIEDLSRRVIAGSYPGIPSGYSLELRQVISQLLQVDPSRRLSAAQMLGLPTMAAKQREIATMFASLDATKKALDATAPMIGTIAAPGMLNLRKLHDVLPLPTFPVSNKDNMGAEFYDAMAALGVRDSESGSVSKKARENPAPSLEKPSILAFQRPMYVPPPEHAIPSPPGLRTASNKVRPAGGGAMIMKKGGISDLITAVRAELAVRSAEDPPTGTASPAAGAGLQPPKSTPFVPTPPAKQVGRRIAPRDREFTRPEWWG